MSKGRNRVLQGGASFCGVFLLFILAAFKPFSVPSTSGKPLTTEEACGKKIYREGVNCRGDVVHGVLGDMEVGGKTEACANCHGSDGRGRPESGQDPGDITWEHLSVPYGHSHTSGRKHPAFTEGSFDRTILKGVDPEQHPLSSLMPRFSMGAQDLKELRAYLRKLSTDFDPGVEDEALRIASLLPLHGLNAEAGQVVRAVLSGYFDDMNGNGGVYNRRITLDIVEMFDDPQAANLGPMVDRDFALIAPWVAGADSHFYSSTPLDGMPVLGPLSLFSSGLSPSNDGNESNVFYLSPGLAQMEAEMVRFAISQKGAQAARSLIVWGDKTGRLQSDMSQTVLSIWRDHGAGVPMEVGWQASGTPGGNSQQTAIESVFFIGTGEEMLEWMNLSISRNSEWRPQVFALGPLLGDEVFHAPAQFEGKIDAAFPALDMEAAAMAEFERFAAKHHLPKEHRMLQVSAYCAARILEEALTRAGRDLSRRKLVHSLEQVRDFKTGLLPPMSFGPNRRIGSTKTEVLCADSQQRKFQRECGVAARH